jgi:hypothetical protein
MISTLWSRRGAPGIFVVVVVLSAVPIFSNLILFPADEPRPEISAQAAQSCSTKVKALQEFETARRKPGTQTTHVSQEEINSYLALDLSSKYHPSLKGLTLTLGQDQLEGEALIDFDGLGTGSSKLLSRLMTFMLSGIHTLNAKGKLVAQEGMAKFVLDEAHFDGNTIPRFLVEEIISAVGRKQKPPFDPLQPSRMPYKIEKVEVKSGYVLIYQ